MKTRTNQPVDEIKVSDITKIPQTILRQLKSGDIVVKITGKQKHAYIVSYKGQGAGEGICLTYTDASCVETISYDYNSVSGLYVYNSKDVTPIADYSEDISEIQTSLQGKANLSGAFFSGAISAPEVLERNSGFSFTKASDTASNEFNYVFAGVVKTGNKVTFALAFEVTKLGSATSGQCGDFTIPQSLYNKLFPVTIGGNNYLSKSKVVGIDATDLTEYDVSFSSYKAGGNVVRFTFNNSNITNNATAYIRIEVTFLTSDNLAE